MVAFANHLMSKFPGLVATSWFRPGGTSFHGKGQAVDLSSAMGIGKPMDNAAGYINQSGIWQQLAEGTLGKLEVFEWNGITPYFESAEGRKMAATKLRAKFEKGVEDRFDVVLRETEGKWLISQLQSFFPETSSKAAGKAGQGGKGSNNDVFNF